MKMRNFITCFFTTTVMLIFLQHHLVASLSPIKQKTALFQFKQSLSITTPTNCFYRSYDGNYHEIPSHPKTMNWSMSSDYCTWEGVSCQPKTGDVIGLDLSCSQLEGAILPNSTLFQLSHLQFLNLSQNDFSLSNRFPQEFGFFAKGLTHLNLSHTGFSGRVPSGISHLYKLVSLDLKGNYGTQLEDEVFKSLLQNLTQLRVLNLKYVNISSVLPVNVSTSLRVLNLLDTGLHGVVPQEVFHLPNLEVLVLSNNEILTATLPLNFSTSLRVLILYDTGLHGVVPREVFHLPNLELLFLSSSDYNLDYGDYNLSATLPKVKWGSSASLQYLYLGGINLYGGIPDSIGFLESLGSLQLYGCNLSGPIPRSIGNLSHLTVLGLRDNNLNGPIPRSIGHLGQLTYLGLTYNNLNGPIPTDLANLTNLRFLDLSHNNFSGVLDFEMFSRLEILDTLVLSHNSLLSVRSASMTTLPPKLRELGLSSCNMKEFPHFSRDAEISLNHVDLSNNQIQGEIPHWIGLMGTYSYSYLNISHNRLTGGLEQLPWNNIQYLDLHSNMLNGSLPTLFCNSSSLEILSLSHNNISGVLPTCPTNLTSLSVFDLRMNKIQGNIPATLSNFRSLETINLHGNKLEGIIPSSFAEFDYLKILDLGSNHINDTFPHCLEGLPNLQVLVLKSNKFHGLINTSSKVEHPFPSLRIIDLSYNEFSGPLPAIYFRNFKAMMNGEVNKIQRSYMERYGDSTASSSPVYYSDSTSLVIKGIDIVLERILTVFTTIDVSRNNFEGEIAEYIGNLMSLRFLNLSHNHLTGHIPPSIGKLTVLESLDLSSNQLGGEIPQQLTGIYSLALLNLSCNQLRGHIPQGSQFNTFENDSYVGNLGLCGNPLSKKCENYFGTQEEEEDEDDDYFFSGFTWEAVAIGYGCGVVPAFIIGYLMLLARKPKWFVGIIARELGLKIRRMEIKWR